MLNDFQRYWNVARFIAIVAGGTIYISQGHAHGFAPILDVKMPSRHGLELKERDRKDQNRKEWNKYQDALSEERSHYDDDGNRRDSGDMDIPDIDYSQIVDYERDNCG
jgi:hypothetical protein